MNYTLLDYFIGMIVMFFSIIIWRHIDIMNIYGDNIKDFKFYLEYYFRDIKGYEFLAMYILMIVLILNPIVYVGLFLYGLISLILKTLFYMTKMKRRNDKYENSN